MQAEAPPREVPAPRGGQGASTEGPQEAAEGGAEGAAEQETALVTVKMMATAMDARTKQSTPEGNDNYMYNNVGRVGDREHDQRACYAPTRRNT